MALQEYLDGTARRPPVEPIPPVPVVPVLPPVPKPRELAAAPPEVAKPAVDRMTPADLTAFQGEVAQLPASDQQAVANGLAGNLDAPQLTKLAPTFAPGTLTTAVNSFAPPAVKADYQVAQAVADPATVTDLASIGLTPESLGQASDTAVPLLLGAASDAAAGRLPEALQKLTDAGRAGEPLAAAAIAHAAGQSNLPPTAKAILSDPAVIGQLITAAPDTIGRVVNGDLAGAVTGLAGPENKPLRDAVIHAALTVTDSPFSKAVGTMGLDEASLIQAVDTAPQLIQAAQHLADGKPREAALAAVDAIEAAPDAAAGVLQALGGQLPPGMANTVLSNPAVAQQLATASPDALRAVINGDAGAALEGLAGNIPLRDAVIDAAVTDPKLQPVLERAGITAADLKGAADAAPHLLSAMQHLAAGEVDQALQSLGQAGNAAPTLLPKVATAIYSALPDGVKGQLAKLGFDQTKVGEAAAAMPNLVAAAQAMDRGDWKTAVNEVLAAGEAAPTLGKEAIQNLGAAIPADPKFALAKNLLADDAVATALASDPELHGAIGDLLDGKTMEGASRLLRNDAVRDSVLTVVSQDPTVAAGLDRIGLTSAEFVQAGAAAPHLIDAATALAGGRWEDAVNALGQVGTNAPDLVAKASAKLVEQMPPAMVRKLDSLGITQDDLKGAGAALPSLVNAANQAASGQLIPALQSLAGAAQAAPDLTAKVINNVAEKIVPTNAKYTLLKSVLTDPTLVSTLVGDASLHASLGKLLSGEDIGGGIRDIANNAGAVGALSNVLANDPAVMNALKPLGIENAADIAAIGPAIGDAVDLVDAINSGQVGPAISSFGALAQNLPENVRNTIIDNVADKLRLSPDMKELLKGSVEAIANPEVAQSLGKAFEAFQSGNPAEFMQALASAGKTIAEQSPSLAKTFLNSLDKLPGTAGKFFADHALNAAIVDSGSLPSLFGAVEKLAGGDMAGAVGELGNVITKLLGHGEKYSVAGVDLPVGKEGLDAIGKLMNQFVEAMPQQVKDFVKEKAAKVVADAGFKSIPFVGPAWGVIEAGGNLASSIANGEDGLTIALNAADLVVNGAGIIPGVSGLTAPLRTLIGVGRGLNETVSFVNDMSDFASQFTGTA